MPKVVADGVNVVVVIKLFACSRRILIQQWHRNQLEPSCFITIKPRDNKTLDPTKSTDPEDWVVEGAPMFIDFEHVFLRKVGEGEQDFEVTADWLVRYYAPNVWAFIS